VDDGVDLDRPSSRFRLATTTSACGPPSPTPPTLAMAWRPRSVASRQGLPLRPQPV